MDVMLPKNSYLGAIDPSSFFSEMYGSLKDGANYIISEGNKPYVLSNTLIFNQDVDKIPYWFSYRKWMTKGSPDGYLQSIHKGYTITDVGVATRGKKIAAFDFIFNGHKTVIETNYYISLKQEKTAFQISAEKATKLRELKNQLALTTASMQKIGLKLAAVRAHNNQLNPDQLKMVNTIQDAYNANAAALLKSNGIKVSASVRQGLGEPVSTVVISLIVIVVASLALFAIYEIVKLITDAKKYQDESDTQAKILDSYLAALSDPKTTPEQKKIIQAKVDQIEKKSEDKQTDIIKNEESTDIFSSIKNLAITGLLIFGGLEIYKAVKK